MIAHIDVEYVEGQPHYLIRFYKTMEDLANNEKCYDLYECEMAVCTEYAFEHFNDKRLEEVIHERYLKEAKNV